MKKKLDTEWSGGKQFLYIGGIMFHKTQMFNPESVVEHFDRRSS